MLVVGICLLGHLWMWMLVILPHSPSDQLKVVKFPFAVFQKKAFSSSSLENEVLSAVSNTWAIPAVTDLHPRGCRQCVSTYGKIPQSFQFTLGLLKTKSRESFVHETMENTTDNIFSGLFPTSHIKRWFQSTKFWVWVCSFPDFGDLEQQRLLSVGFCCKETSMVGVTKSAAAGGSL